VDNDQGESDQLDRLSKLGHAALAKETKRLRRIAAANIIRGVRRRNGLRLSDVAVASRVPGMVPSEVRAVREEIERNGVLQDELDVPPDDREGT